MPHPRAICFAFPQYCDVPRKGTEMLGVMAQNQVGRWFLAFGYQQNYQQPPCPLFVAEADIICADCQVGF
jgi:hypothetical protein